MDLDRPAGILETGDHPQRGGLATPRRAEDGDYPALPHVEAEVIQGDGVAEGPGQVPSADSQAVSR
jgi:hypothetical protein